MAVRATASTPPATDIEEKSDARTTGAVPTNPAGVARRVRRSVYVCGHHRALRAHALRQDRGPEDEHRDELHAPGRRDVLHHDREELPGWRRQGGDRGADAGP